jgi:hypothetical protein
MATMIQIVAERRCCATVRDFIVSSCSSFTRPV